MASHIYHLAVTLEYIFIRRLKLLDLTSGDIPVTLLIVGVSVVFLI
jgi:hypothetical protein